MISDLVSQHGEGAYEAITYFEKFKLVESRWEVNNESGRPERVIVHLQCFKYLHP